MADYRDLLYCIDLLLKAGADVNTADFNGCTALMFAVKNENVSVIEMLLAAGADINAVDYKWRTALMHTKNSEIIKILEKAHKNNIATEIINKTSLPLDILGEIFEFYDVDSKILKDARNREYGASK